MSKITVVDYGSSNLRSVEKALQHVGGADHTITVSSDPDVIRGADRVVFPGQGAIGDCMLNLDKLGLRDALNETMRDRPFLGICLGLQSLLDHSDEGGGVDGLGLISGTVKHFPTDLSENGERLKIPHMGWNTVTHNGAHPLWAGIDDEARFYFVHSYFAQPDDDIVQAGKTTYGIEFCSVAATGNLFAVQFHPEKSQHAGLKLLENFLGWDGQA